MVKIVIFILGRNDNFQFFELITKKLVIGIFASKIGHFLGLNRKFMWPDPRPPDFEPDSRRWEIEWYRQRNIEKVIELKGHRHIERDNYRNKTEK